MASPTILNLKIAVCGPGGVGKSCLTIQFVQNQFIETWDPTIEDSYQKHLQIDGYNIMLDILDTAGQEEYKALRDEYMRKASGFILVYDIGDEKTFRELPAFRKHIQRSKDNDSPPIVIVANKSDLPDELKQMKSEEAREALKDWNVPIMEASAKTRTNVDEVFELTIREMLKEVKKKDEEKQDKELLSGKKNPNNSVEHKKRGTCSIL